MVLLYTLLRWRKNPYHECRSDNSIVVNVPSAQEAVFSVRLGSQCRHPQLLSKRWKRSEIHRRSCKKGIKSISFRMCASWLLASLWRHHDAALILLLHSICKPSASLRLEVDFELRACASRLLGPIAKLAIASQSEFNEPYPC